MPSQISLQALLLTSGWGFVLGACCWALAKNTTPRWLRPYLLPVLVLHLLGGLGVGLVYLYLYVGSGDTFTAYQDAIQLQAQVNMHPASFWQVLLQPWGITRTTWFSRLLAVVLWPTYGNYWAASLFFSAYSFSGTWSWACQLLQRNLAHARLMAAVLLLLPSSLFWGDGILKEAVAIGSLGWTLSLVDSYCRQGRLGKGQALLLGVTLLLGLLVKPFIWVALLPFLAMWVMLTHPRRPIRWGVGALAALLCGYLFWFSSAYNLHQVQAEVRYLRQVALELPAAGPTWQLNLGQGWAGLLLASPAGLFTTLFRPLPWEAQTATQCLAGLEGLGVLGILVWGCRVLPSAKKLFKAEPWLLPMVMFCLLYATFLGLTVPNVGTLVRYRVVVVPLLAGLVVFARARATAINSEL